MRRQNNHYKSPAYQGHKKRQSIMRQYNENRDLFPGEKIQVLNNIIENGYYTGGNYNKPDKQLLYARTLNTPQKEEAQKLIDALRLEMK